VPRLSQGLARSGNVALLNDDLRFNLGDLQPVAGKLLRGIGNLVLLLGNGCFGSSNVLSLSSDCCFSVGNVLPLLGDICSSGCVSRIGHLSAPACRRRATAADYTTR
jgi:hypothetical protein